MVTQAQRRQATMRAILTAARHLFAGRGFEATSIDDIAAACALAKGAVYHHFSTKRELFEQVLEAVQAELAAAPPPDGAHTADPVDAIVLGVRRYLLDSSEPGIRQILLIDGPAVIGWRQWREIDFRYFGGGARQGVKRLLGARASKRAVDAATHLLMGAVTEAALVCATSPQPARQAEPLLRALRSMLEGLREG